MYQDNYAKKCIFQKYTKKLKTNWKYVYFKNIHEKMKKSII